MEFLDHEPPEEDEVQQEVAEILSNYTRWPQFGRWIASCCSTGEYMGWFALTVCNEDPSALALEFGYRLRRRFWGTGLATEGTQMLIQYAFGHQSVDRVFGQTMFVNSRSRRVMERCGMRYVRTFHVEFDDPLPGTEMGEVEYEMTREEWERR